MIEHWLIIGAAGGIAQGLIQQLLAEGHQVSAISRQAASGAAPQLSWYQLAAAKDPAAEVSPELEINLKHIFSQPVTAVVLCQGWLHGAGMLPEKSLKQLTRQSLQQSLEVNLFSVAFYLQALLPLLQKQPGIKVAVLSAKVGSISDNRLGGWYSYRMAKAALNMLVKCTSIELNRVNKTAALFSLHPGTTDSALSAPFQQNLPAGQLKTAAETARNLLATIRAVSEAENGLLVNWNGQIIDF
jgi:NAD(P)-dependent dehydrogenase (short-subunit alcohol dehydrogenase family)